MCIGSLAVISTMLSCANPVDYPLLQGLYHFHPNCHLCCLFPLVVWGSSLARSLYQYHQLLNLWMHKELKWCKWTRIFSFTKILVTLHKAKDAILAHHNRIQCMPGNCLHSIQPQSLPWARFRKDLTSILFDAPLYWLCSIQCCLRDSIPDLATFDTNSPTLELKTDAPHLYSMAESIFSVTCLNSHSTQSSKVMEEPEYTMLGHQFCNPIAYPKGWWKHLHAHDYYAPKICPPDPFTNLSHSICAHSWGNSTKPFLLMNSA